MKIIMIGTPTCSKCKSIEPVIREYCEESKVDFSYMNLSEVSSDIMNLLVSNNVKQAPAFLIFRAGETIVVSGDDIFVEMKKFK